MISKDKKQLIKTIQKIGKNDKDAFKELYLQYNVYLFRIALTYVHNKENAEDIVEDSFLKIYLNAKKYIPLFDPEGWIVNITKNLAKDFLRKQDRTKKFESFLMDSNNMLNERFDCLTEEELFKCLNDDEKIILKLRILGYTNSEITDITSYSYNQITYAFKTAKAKIEELKIF